MARSTVFERTQLGLESTAGTGVAANKVIESLSLGDPSPQAGYSAFRPEGSKFNVLMRKGKEHVTIPFTQALDYNGLVYVLSSLVGTAVPAQQGATAAYLWTFKPTTGPDTFKTYTIERGSSSRAMKWVYGIFRSLSFSVASNSEETDASGDILAQATQDGITMTNSPSQIEAVPVLPQHWDVKIADTQAGLSGASALDEVLNFDWSYGEKYAPLFNVYRNTTFADVVEQAADIGGMLQMVANSDAMAYLTTTRNVTQKWLQLEAVGDLIETTYYYTLQIQMPIYFAQLPSFGDAEGAYAATFAYIASLDATLASALQIKVTNTVTAL